MYSRSKHSFETAIRVADLAEAARLAPGMQKVSDPWTPDEIGRLFTEAIHAGDAAATLLGILLEAGFDPNAVDDSLSDDYCYVPLSHAVRAGRLDLVELLVAAGADIHWRSPTGATLMSHCWPSHSWQEPRPDTPDVRAVRDWLSARGIQLDPLCPDSRRRLYWAASRPVSWPDVFAYFELGFDPSVVGWSDVMADIAADRLTAVQAGALTAEQLNHRDTHDRTPFLLAVQGGRLEVARAIFEAHPDRLREGADEFRPSALHLAAQENLPGMLSWLVEKGLEVDFCTNPGETALHTAVSDGCLEAARTLIELGADVRVRNKFGGMIHEANRFDIMQLLVEHGAEINDVDGCGEWPLKMMCGQGEVEAVRWLLAHGAQPDLTSTGETALFDAVRSRSIPCVAALLDAGADVNAQDVDDWTCLFLPASTEMAEYLLSRGADPAIRDQCNGLPEDWNGTPAAVRAMLKAARLAS